MILAMLHSPDILVVTAQHPDKVGVKTAHMAARALTRHRQCMLGVGSPVTACSMSKDPLQY